MALTNAERRQVQAYYDAMEEAMASITEFDAERVYDARKAVADAHPIDETVRLAYLAEKNEQYGDQLSGTESTLKNSSLSPEAPWGLVIYRTAYGDDTAWERMLVFFHDTITNTMANIPMNKHLAVRHRFEIMNDKDEFQGLTIDQARQRFAKWAVDEFRRNCREHMRPAEAELMTADGKSKHLYSAGPRYNFFLLIDEVCLESLDNMSIPVVKFVDVQGTPQYSVEDVEEMGAITQGSPWEGGRTESEFEDVGWMYIEVTEYVNFQQRLNQPDDWQDVYIRPPLMFLNNDFESAPGFWRRATKLSSSE